MPMPTATSQKVIQKIKKRNGTFVTFDIQKIIQAIQKAMQAAGESSIQNKQRILNMCQR
jgi:anaerobic ribonucleoside-triphosphate reductase